MQKKSVALITVLMVSIGLFGEKTIDQKIADLEKKLQTVSGKAKIEVLNKLSHIIRRKSPGNGIEYGNQALELSQKLKDEEGEATALQNIGESYRIMGDNKKALEYAKNSLKTSERSGSKKAIAASLSNIGMVYHRLSNYSKALECFQKSLKIYEKVRSKKGISRTLSNIGVVYFDLGNYDRSLKYHLDSLKIRDEIQDKLEIAHSLSNIGIIYKKINNYDKALEYHLESLKTRKGQGDKLGIAGSLNNIGIIYYDLGNYDKALEYYLQSLKIYEEIGNKLGIATTLCNIGVDYIELSNFNKALEYQLKSLKISEEIGDRWLIGASLTNIGDVYIKLEKFDGAFSNLSKGLKISKKIKAKDLIKEIYKSFSKLYISKGDYKKALEYYKLYSEVKDSIFNEKSSKQIAEMQTRYETLEKEKRIEILEKNSEIQELRFSKERFTRDAFIIGFILVSVILVLVFKKYLNLFSLWKKQRYIEQFRLMEEIGSGGMGTIYKAYSIRDRTNTVAVKVLKQELFKDENSRKRFKLESTIIDKLDHPNIIKIIEWGEYKEKLFIAMEFLQGKTLKTKIDEESQLDLKECFHIMIQVSDALILVHSKNIIHRDLKPSNIMLIERDGDSNFVKLMDFGLAKMKFHTRLTTTGILLGTINYMSPEQFSNSEFSSASDVYSLGVTFYEMVTGIIAFPGDTATDIMMQTLDKTLIEPIRFRPDLPVELNDLIMKMLEKNKESRPVIKEVFETLHTMQSKFKYKYK